MGFLQVSPEALLLAAAELEALAIRTEGVVAAASPSLATIPAGSEEVSFHAAAYFQTLAASYQPAIRQAIAEMYALAGTLKKQAAEYAAQDAMSGGAIARIM
ncbi:MAG: PE domain-containing protein [Rhodococcus sp.]|nr:PE domain-containing protein [Rhodococcus sp. (in: high G+C Gram-positive bacteria)]